MFKTDAWIAAMCLGAPTALMKREQLVTYMTNHYIKRYRQRIPFSDDAGLTTLPAHHHEENVNPVDFIPMISPFVESSVRVNEAGEKVISYGLSSMGYDVRLAKGLKVFTNVNNAILDPKGLDPAAFVDKDDDVVIIPPNGFALGHTVETFNVPRDVLIVCLGKSTYARAGVAINVTPIEPGFKGQVVIEIANTTNLPVKIYTGEGIAQFLFGQSDENCLVSYDDRGGKYQNQSGIQLPLV